MKTRRANGEGSIYKDNDRYKGYITLGRKPDGKIIRKYFTGKTKISVAAAIKKFKEEKGLLNPSSEPITLEKYITYWLKNVQYNNLKPQSYDRLDSTVRNHIIPEIGFLQFASITTHDIQCLINKKYNDEKLSYSSVKKIKDCLNSCYNYNLKLSPKERIVNYNPCSAVILKRRFENSNENCIKCFTKSEIFKIKEELSRTAKSNNKKIYPYGAVYILMLNTGIRLGEVSALNKSDVDLKGNKIKVCKNQIRQRCRDENKNISQGYSLSIVNSVKTSSSERWIPLNSAAMNACLELLELFPENPALICNKYGDRITLSALEKTFKQVLKKCGIPSLGRGIHALRHTFASFLIQNNIDVKIVSDILGHSSSKITYDVYTHIFDEHKKDLIDSLPAI